MEKHKATKNTALTNAPGISKREKYYDNAFCDHFSRAFEFWLQVKRRAILVQCPLWCCHCVSSLFTDHCPQALMTMKTSGFPTVRGIFKQHVKMSQVITVDKTGKKKSFIFLRLFVPLSLLWWLQSSSILMRHIASGKCYATQIVSWLQHMCVSIL